MFGFQFKFGARVCVRERGCVFVRERGCVRVREGVCVYVCVALNLVYVLLQIDATAILNNQHWRTGAV